MKLRTVDGADVEFLELFSPSAETLREAWRAMDLEPTDPQKFGGGSPRFELSEKGYRLVLSAYGGSEGNLLVFFNVRSVLVVHRTEKTTPLPWDPMTIELRGEVPTLPLVVRLLLEVVFSYEAPLDEIEEQTNEMENHILDDEDVPGTIQGVYHLKRRLGDIHRTHRLLIDQMGKMAIRFESQRYLLSDPLAEAETSLQFATRMLDNLHHLINVQISLASHRTNEIVRVLTLFSVVFMPLTFIAGIYGMNFAYFPELRWKWGYPGVLIFMGLTAFAIVLWFRKKGWWK